MTNTMIGLIQTVLLAIYGVITAFDVWTMTDTQRGAVLALYGALAAIVLLLNNTYGKTAKIKAAARAQGTEVPSL
jgi:hypothetical protein